MLAGRIVIDDDDDDGRRRRPWGLDVGRWEGAHGRFVCPHGGLGGAGLPTGAVSPPGPAVRRTGGGGVLTVDIMDDDNCIFKSNNAKNVEKASKQAKHALPRADPIAARIKLIPLLFLSLPFLSPRTPSTKNKTKTKKQQKQLNVTRWPARASSPRPPPPARPPHSPPPQSPTGRPCSSQPPCRSPSPRSAAPAPGPGRG